MGIEHVDLHLIDSSLDAIAFTEWMGTRRPWISVDTETTGLNPYTGDHVRLIQVGDRDSGWAAPWFGWGGFVIDALRKYDGRLVFHNAKFDMAFLTPAHIDGRSIEVCRWDQVEDTMLMAWLLEPHQPCGLKSLCDRYVDPRASAMQSVLHSAMAAQKWTWATVPVDFHTYWAYGALDVVLTSRIYEELAPRIATDDALMDAYRLELAALPIAAGMERRGAAVDPEYAGACIGRFEDRITALDDWCRTEHGIRRGSNTQALRRLTELGAELTERTPSGAFSLNAKVKEQLITTGSPVVRELVTAIQEAGQLTKLCGSYLSHIKDGHHNGRIHASINTIGAREGQAYGIRTGRMSVTDPIALQTLPRAHKDNPAAIEVRNCFVPRAEGNRLAMVDFDQIELRIVAHYSQDPSLGALLKDPTLDPFSAMASQIFGETIGKGDERRQYAKNATYALLYGAGLEKFSATAGIDETTGQGFLSAYFSTFPGIKVLQNRSMQSGWDRLRDEGEAYVRTHFGHRLVADSKKIYALLNYLIQGTSAGIMKSKLIEMDNAGLGEYMVLPVHDEIILDAPEEDIIDVARTAGEIMSDETTFAVPLRASPDGPYVRWGHKYQKGT